MGLPLLLFCFAAWQGYKVNQRVAEDQIESGVEAEMVKLSCLLAVCCGDDASVTVTVNV